MDRWMNKGWIDEGRMSWPRISDLDSVEGLMEARAKLFSSPWLSPLESLHFE